MSLPVSRSLPVVLPLMAAALGACSAGPSKDDGAAAANGATAIATDRRGIHPASAPVIETGDDRARPGALRTFDDWTAGCDNTALCTMASLGAQSGAFPDVTMALLRQPGPGGAYDLSFEVAEDGDAVTPSAILVDTRRIALPTLNGAPAAAVAGAMANGRTLAIVGSDGQVRARISLAGASAALRYIDAVQGRAGTATATVAKGPQPATTIPQGPDAPLVRAIPPTGEAARPTRAQFAAMRKRARCEGDDAAAATAPEAHALGGGATLVLIPCSAGAYNLSSALFVMRGSSIEPALVDAPSGFAPDDAGAVPGVVNGDWSDGVLASFARGRGLGDCGVRQQFVWDGRRFRLTEQAEMGDCRGNRNYITTWRADVIRR